MNVCDILTLCYGRDTRPAQVVNILLSGMWFLLLLLHHLSIVLVDIPVLIKVGIIDTMVFAFLSMMFSTIGIFVKGRKHQVIKLFGLSLGAVFNGILANGYFTAYPPLEMMLVICLSMAVWFTGGAIYIIKCEDMYEHHR